MRKYYISLLVITLVMVLATFCVMWFSPENFIYAMPLLALYFGLIMGVQHYVVVRSMHRSPRVFVQVFLGSTVAVLFIHLIVLAIYLFTHPMHVKTFTIAFCIGYVVSLIFETTAMVRFVQRIKKDNTDH